MNTSVDWQTIKEYEEILFSQYKGIAKISINRPHKHNAFTPQTVKEMSEAMEYCRQEPSIGVIVLTGEGEERFVVEETKVSGGMGGMLEKIQYQD